VGAIFFTGGASSSIGQFLERVKQRTAAAKKLLPGWLRLPVRFGSIKKVAGSMTTAGTLPQPASYVQTGTRIAMQRSSSLES
jgi:hypothetical protein